MDRSQLIKVIKEHSNTVAERNVENLADHLIAVIVAYYEKLETETRVNRNVLKSLGINHD